MIISLKTLPLNLWIRLHTTYIVVYISTFTYYIDIKIATYCISTQVKVSSNSKKWPRAPAMLANLIIVLNKSSKPKPSKHNKVAPHIFNNESSNK